MIAAASILFVTNRPATAPSKPSIDADQQSSAINAQPVETNKVYLQGHAFTPTVIAIHKNRSVIWTNNDAMPYAIAVTDGNTQATSDTLNTGASYSFVFDQVGTFRYHLIGDPTVEGTVIVRDDQ